MKERGFRARAAAGTHRRRAVRPILEGLEDRMLLYSVTGDHFTNGTRITWSIMPDGTNIAGTSSNFIATMNARFGQGNWLGAFSDAFAEWENVAGVNFSQVPDYGEAWGSGNYQQGDPDFGDIRIGGYTQSSNVLAVTTLPPAANGGSDAGDIFFNTAQMFNMGSDYDLETVALHEIGHALGLGHSTNANAVMYPYYGGVEQVPLTDDIAGVQSIWGARQEDPIQKASGNQTSAKAFDVTGWLNSSTDSEFLPSLDVASSAESYWFKVTAPASSSSTLTIQVQSSNFSELSPHVLIYNSSIQGLSQASASPTTYGATVAASASITPGSTYYVRVLGSNSGASGTGAYVMTFNLGTGPIYTAPPPNTQVAAQADQGGGSELLTIGDVGGWIKTWLRSGVSIPISAEETRDDPSLSATIEEVGGELPSAGAALDAHFDAGLTALLQEIPLVILGNSLDDPEPTPGGGPTPTLESYVTPFFTLWQAILSRGRG